MTSRVSQALVESLAAHREDGPVLSLYMPTALEVDERRQNEIRLKNLLRQARSRLETLGMAGTGAQALTERVDKAPLEREMWQAHGRGFAVFSGRDLLAHAALPFRVRELVVASPRFQLRPLIEALARQRRFWLLAMSQKDVRLYRGDEKALTEVDTGSHLPRSLVEVAGREPTGKELYFHSANRGGEAAIFHGTGAGKDDVEPEQEQFVRAVATGLEHFLKQDDSPVILAADNQLRALYARVSRHAERVLDEIDGNVEHVPEESLHAESWRRMEAELERRRDTELYRLGNSGPELPVSADLADIVRAATEGRIDTLFTAADRHCWGRWDASERTVEIHDQPLPGDDDLLDFAAVESWLKGGAVHAVPGERIPGNGMVIAGLRY